MRDGRARAEAIDSPHRAAVVHEIEWSQVGISLEGHFEGMEPHRESRPGL